MADVAVETAERDLVAVEVRPSLVLFWFKATLHASTKRVSGAIPNSILGVIPAGKRDVMIPMKQIASISTSSEYSFLRIIVGALILLVGLAQLPSLGGIVIAILGLALLLGGFRAGLVISSSGGTKEKIIVSILDKEALNTFAKETREQIARM